MNYRTVYYNICCTLFCIPRPVEGIASLLQMAADSLRHPDGHLYYLGADLFGVLGYELSTTIIS